MVFYTATGFPQEHRNDAFIAMRGSPTAHRLQARTGSFQDGKPVGLRTSSQDSCLKTDQYISGDWLSAPDGSLLISEDTNGVIYRVSPLSSRN